MVDIKYYKNVLKTQIRNKKILIYEMRDLIKEVEQERKENIRLMARVSAENTNKQYEQLIRIFRWLMGYYRFPDYVPEKGHWSWRSDLQKKLKRVGIDIHKRKAKRFSH